MTITETAQHRGITDVLHFTTNSGLTGIAATHAIKPRSELTENRYIEYILKHNCRDRSKDKEWHGHVNLSITKINARLFQISDGKWHQQLDGWWCILSLHPEILAHPGVWFTTTNNIYPSVKRAPGDAGLQAMFAQKVEGMYHNPIFRAAGHPDAEPTCRQAEVLYPGDLSLDHVQRIYFREAEHADAAYGIFGAFSLTPPPLIVSPEHFR